MGLMLVKRTQAIRMTLVKAPHRAIRNIVPQLGKEKGMGIPLRPAEPQQGTEEFLRTRTSRHVGARLQSRMRTRSIFTD